jgi:dUTP pyrophosphatase
MDMAAKVARHLSSRVDDRTLEGLGRFDLIALLRQVSKERDAYLENLTSVQARCTELLEEKRRLVHALSNEGRSTPIESRQRDCAVVRFIGEQPTRATDGSVGWDLVAARNVNIRSGETVMIETNTRIALPPGFEASVRGRSGLSRSGVITSIGTIDHDYRGPIGVIATYLPYPIDGYGNVGWGHVWPITAGDRIAQLVIQRVPEVRWERVEKLDETARGERGFGSSGK